MGLADFPRENLELVLGLLCRRGHARRRLLAHLDSRGGRVHVHVSRACLTDTFAALADVWGVIALFAKLVGHDVRIREQSVVAPLVCLDPWQSMVCARILHEVSDGTSQLAGKKRGNDIRAHQVGWQYPRVHPVRWACQVCVKIAALENGVAE